MTETTRRTALAACLALGGADLMALNLSVVPRVRLQWMAQRARPQPMVAVAIEGAPPQAAVVEEPAAPTVAAVTPSELPPVVEPSTVYFPTNVARLGAAERAQVDRLARQSRGERTFVVDGHADARGREVYNERLSKQRALSVAARLIRRGVPQERVEVRAYGATRPRSAGDDPESLQRNRRVEVFMRGENP